MKYRFLPVCCLLVGTAAGGAYPSAAPPVPGAKAAPSQTAVSLDLKQTPLNQALDILFSQLGLQYTIEAGTYDPPITMKVRDIPFEEALRAMLRLVNVQGTVPVTYRKEGVVYEIGMRRPEPATGPPAGGGGFPGVGSPGGGFPGGGFPSSQREVPAEKLPINFLRPSDAVSYLNQQPVPGIASIQPLPRDNSVIVRGDPDAIQDLKRLLQLADVPPRPLTLTAGISGPGVNGTPLAIRSAARTLVGDDVTIDEQSVLGGQPAHLKVTLRTQLLGTGDLQITSDWDVSVPVAGGPRGPIRLVKRLSTTTEIRPGEQVPVAEADLSGWGGKGVLRLWIRGDWGERGVIGGRSAR
jgi:type II/III secretion system protein